MLMHTTRELQEGDLYLAGERVPPGEYRQIGTNRVVCLEQEDYLPASLDGRVACYERILHTWAAVQALPQGEETCPLIAPKEESHV